MERSHPTGKQRERAQCPLCHERVSVDLRSHIVAEHGEEAFRKAVLADKERGMSDPEIGARYGISFGTLERILIEAYGANVSVLKRPKRIRRWQPPDFREETTTVWSFKQRGDWATHNGRYRGNWSPYVPRNIILKYSRPGDTVLDYFVGGGTTAIEAKLLGRRCIAMDINPGAVGITLENLRFSPPRGLFGEQDLPLYEPKVKVGDARDLSDIPDDSIDLICAHPPYAGIIKYSAKIQGDLSSLTVQGFLTEMRRVAAESWRVLKPGGKCAILIGDARKSKHVIPVGFQTIQVFLDVGFTLRELIIKRQHNCRTTGFWYSRSIRYNFLLLAHEYLPVFEKPLDRRVEEERSRWEYALPHQSTLERIPEVGEEGLETTTVWILPADRLDAEIKRNLVYRFAGATGQFVQIRFDGDKPGPLDIPPLQDVQLLFIRSAGSFTREAFEGYRAAVKRLVARSREILPPNGFLVLEGRDFRLGSIVVPAGLLLWEDMRHHRDFVLRDIIIVVPEEASPQEEPGEHLQIVHRYLLVYRRKEVTP